MSGEIEAAGALATAGMAARAIEGGGGHGPVEGDCRNCGATLAGAFCHACGQPAHISRTLGDVFHDFMHSVLHFDTKAWRTLPMLAVRPGGLTHDYIHGRRARYISPLALFLFTIFLMFFVFSVVGGGETFTPRVTERVVTQEDVAAARERLDTALRDEAEAKVALARAESATPPPHARDAEEAREDLSDATSAVATQKERLAKLEERLSRQRAAIEKAASEIAAARATLPADAPVADRALAAAQDAVDRAKATEPPRDGIEVSIGDKQAARPASQGRWQDELRDAVEEGRVNVNFGNKKLDDKVRQSLLNPDLALYKLQQTTYKFSFLLVPISLPFIALLFLWRRGVTLFDHVVFSLYSLSFMSLLFLAVALIGNLSEIGAMIAATAVSVIPPVHMFFHLGGTYKLKLWSALWRTTFLLLFVTLAASLFFVAILYLGLAV